MTDAPELHLFLKISIDSSTQSPFIGFCYVDHFNHSLYLGQFHTSDSYSHLTDLLTLQPATAITLGLDRLKIQQLTADRIKALLTSHHPLCNVKEVKLTEFKRTTDIVDELERLVKLVAEVHAVKDRVEGLGAAAAAIKALSLLTDVGAMAQWSLRPFNLSEFMLIDPNAAIALNLFPVEGEADRHMSLFGLLNKGRTPLSSRLLTRWLRQPLTSLPLIQRRQRLLSIFCSSTPLRESIRDRHLRRLPDYQTVLRLFVTGKARLQHIVQLWQALGRIPELVEEMEGYEGEGKEELKTEFIDKLKAIHRMFAPIDDLVHATIDLGAASTGYTYQLNAAIQPSLQGLVDARDAAREEMDKYKVEAEKNLGLLDRISIQQKGEKSGEWVMRVNRADEKAFRVTKGYQIISTNKDGVKFINKRFSDAAKAYSQALADYDREERLLVSQAVATVATYARVLEALIEVIAEVDLMAALAHVCLNAPIPYVEPEVVEGGEGVIEMVQARHPCMEVMDGVHFIPNDVFLRRGQSHLQIITGPNMGGKSTYIRMTGVVQLLAQLGMRVPCNSARVSICDRILTRVGAGDAALKGLSTFMKEMTEATSILSLATPSSLVIIDELGRGTSTWDGFGLARAIAEFLASSIGGFCLISTHFHEMTDMESTTPAVINQHVVVQMHPDAADDSSSIVMTHRVRPGPSGKSFGVNVAKMAKMPAEVVALSKGMAEKMEDWAVKGGALRLKESGGREGEEGEGEEVENEDEELEMTDEEQMELDEFMEKHERWRAAGEGRREGLEVPHLSPALVEKLASF